MPEKSVYRITPEGEHFFMDLMEKTARETVSIFLNFNAVIMNLDFMPEEKRKELLEGIHDGISDLKETIEPGKVEIFLGTSSRDCDLVRMEIAIEM